ncbi:MAG: glycosyltransferase family A protein [Oscillospiraceae bacterium]|nr:glycosyltransferase family A protein [Oscillospiraceae bacterium]
MKLITFTVPCYNSAAYMNHCIDTLLEGGKDEDIEIILVDDGSTDKTGAIADQYAQWFPGIVRVIHQENGGHGEGVNQGIRHASGLYYKVVDSDDWVDIPSMRTTLQKLRELLNEPETLDLLVTNYVYEHVPDRTRHIVRYQNVFPEGRIFSWEDIGRFRVSQNLLMHSVIYRTQLLRDCGLELPKHTFYVDNIFVYYPLPSVKTIYYLNVNLYRYFIGRADQSVNEQVIIKRIDQQLRVTKIMLEEPDLAPIKDEQPKLFRYMFRYLAMMMTISSVFLIIDGSREALQKKQELWAFVKEKDSSLYHRLRYRSLNVVVHLPGSTGRKTCITCYRLAQKVYKFN